ncbi:hypothetical protein A6I91_21215 [Prescottella equi]|nr:hypothetical protein A6I91_21215 [Prescottella equi]
MCSSLVLAPEVRRDCCHHERGGMFRDARTEKVRVCVGDRNGELGGCGLDGFLGLLLGFDLGGELYCARDFLVFGRRERRR